MPAAYVPPDSPGPAGQRTLFTGGAVFDGSGAAPVPADVVVRGPVIESVQVGGGAEPRPGDQVVDCTGLTVMPGLVDSHCHLTFPSGQRQAPQQQAWRASPFTGALRDAGGTVTLEIVPGASHFWDGADDVAGIVARSAGFVRSIWR